VHFFVRKCRNVNEEGVRRALLRLGRGITSATMVSPPWRVESPKGAIHVIVDSKKLKVLASDHELIGANRVNPLADVVGISARYKASPLSDLPLHRSGWQLLDRVEWLEHVASGALVPIIGGDGILFISNFKAWCTANLPGLEGTRLNEFLGKGWYWSNGYEQHVLCSAYRRFWSTPTDPELRVQAFLKDAAHIAAHLPDHAVGLQEVNSLAFSLIAHHCLGPVS
jgi:hypothetical protein